ncbi:hypothetical protein JMJ77_0002446, partial [Colletotrichum scovillei]
MFHSEFSLHLLRGNFPHDSALPYHPRFNQHLNSGHFPASAIRELVSALTKPQFPSTYNLQGSYVDCSAAFISKPSTYRPL